MGGPPHAPRLQKRFALTQKLQRIAKAKADAAKPATTMPASLNASVRVCAPLCMRPLDGAWEACSGRVPGDEGGHGGGPGVVHPGSAVGGREQWLDQCRSIKAVPQKRPPEPSGPEEKRRRRDAWPEGDSEAPSQPSRPAAVLPVAQGDQLFDALAEERTTQGLRASTRMQKVAVCGCPDLRRRPTSRP